MKGMIEAKATRGSPGPESHRRTGLLTKQHLLLPEMLVQGGGRGMYNPDLSPQAVTYRCPLCLASAAKSLLLLVVLDAASSKNLDERPP